MKRSRFSEEQIIGILKEHHACRMIAAWRDDYNQHCPHSSLDGLTPREYHQRSEEDQNLNRANL